MHCMDNTATKQGEGNYDTREQHAQTVKYADQDIFRNSSVIVSSPKTMRETTVVQL